MFVTPSVCRLKVTGVVRLDSSMLSLPSPPLMRLAILAPVANLKTSLPAPPPRVSNDAKFAPATLPALAVVIFHTPPASIQSGFLFTGDLDTTYGVPAFA